MEGPTHDCPSCLFPIDFGLNNVVSCKHCNYWYHISCETRSHSENCSNHGIDYNNWECPKCIRLKTKTLNELKPPSTDRLVEKVTDFQKSMTSASQNVEDIKGTLAYLEEEVKHLQMENSRMHTKHSLLWKSYTYLQEELEEWQEILNGRVVSDYRKKHVKTSILMKLKDLMFYGFLHCSISLIFAFIFSRWIQKTMNTTKITNKRGKM